MRLFNRFVAALALLIFAICGVPANAQFVGSGSIGYFSTGTITPAATAAAIATVQQTFTVFGLATTMDVLLVGPAPTSLCPPVGARVSAANTLQIDFLVLTAAACTPAAGVYKVIARYQ